MGARLPFILLLNIFLSILLTQGYQFHKRWIRTNSWSEPTNWQPPRMPCPHDIVMLSNDVILIENNVTIATGLNFNSDSEIVFGRDTNVVFGENIGAIMMINCQFPIKRSSLWCLFAVKSWPSFRFYLKCKL